MSVLSRIYSKLIFKNFKILKKINIYYRDFGSKSNFAIYIKDMSINFNYKFSKYSSFKLSRPVVNSAVVSS